MLTLEASGCLVAPVHVDLNITDACNLLCAHCHSSSGARSPDELDTDQLVRVARDLYDWGVTSLAVAGGEPFVRRGATDLLASLTPWPGWSVGVITNGHAHADPKRAKDLAARAPSLLVNVSLDGHTPELNGALRRMKATTHDELFATTCLAIENLVAAGLVVAINTTITRETIGCLPEFYDFAESLGVAGVVAIKFLPLGFGAHEVERLDVPFNMWVEHLTSWTALKQEGQLARLALSVASSWEFDLPHVARGIDLAAARRAWRRPLVPEMAGVGDHAGRSTLAVDAAGTAYPSVLVIGDRSVACGSLVRSSVGDLWRSSQVLRRLRALRPGNLSTSCSDCELSGTCGGGSRGRALALSGRIDGPDLGCPLVSSDGASSASTWVEVQGLAASTVQPPSVVRTRAVFGTGRSAVRLIQYPEGFELRTTWALRSVHESQAAEVLAYFERGSQGEPPECLREMLQIPRDHGSGAPVNA